MAASTHLPAPVAGDPARVVADLGRLSLNFRLIAWLLTALALLVEPVPGLPWAVMVTGLGGLLLLWRWERLAPTLMRHPSLLFADLVLAVGILLFAGPTGPFAYYVLGTAFLAGVVYGWGGGMLLSAALVAGYGLVVSVHMAAGRVEGGFQVLVATPALYLLAGAGAAAIRNLLLRKAEAEARLDVAVRDAASSEERARLAREMHDTLGKTLHGIALTAAALPGYCDRKPEQARVVARRVALAAETAAAQARELIADLRSDRLEGALDESVGRAARDWAATTGTGVEVVAEPVPGVSAGSRYELLCILKEALRNVERHAAAAHVRVALHRDAENVVLEVADDGAGLAGPVDLDELAARGHYGLVGMHERARRAGGRLEVAAGPGGGTRLLVTVAATSAADMVPRAPVSPPALLAAPRPHAAGAGA